MLRGKEKNESGQEWKERGWRRKRRTVVMHDRLRKGRTKRYIDRKEG